MMLLDKYVLMILGRKSGSIKNKQKLENAFRVLLGDLTKKKNYSILLYSPRTCHRTRVSSHPINNKVLAKMCGYFEVTGTLKLYLYKHRNICFCVHSIMR